MNQMKEGKTQQKFDSITKKIKGLEIYNEYIGAFIFGSVARNEHSFGSDFDVKILIKGSKSHDYINHPVIHDIKLDITFQTYEQLKKFTEKEIKEKKRVPMIAESIILFDKTGKLNKLKVQAIKIKPKKNSKNDFNYIHFLVHHADTKAKKNLTKDPKASLLSMSIDVNDILKFHYQINRRWWISSKRLLGDLRSWDPKAAKILENFVSTSNIQNKYRLWTKLIEHIVKPIGGRKKISETSCKCSTCRHHLKNLEALQ